MIDEKLIPLSHGVEIGHKGKTYSHKTGIPEKIFNEIYGNLGENEKESKKLLEAKLKKFKPKKEPVKDEPPKTGN